MKIQTLVVLAGLSCLMFAAASHAAPTATCRAHGQASLAAWTQGNDAAAVKDFAPDIAAQVTPDRLKEVWAQLQGSAGAFRKLGDLQPHTLGGHALLAANIDFAQLSFAAVIDCDAQDRITTFRIVPASVLGAATSQAPAPASTVGIERAVQITTPLGPLPGTLLLPKGSGPFPAVLLVAGSGAHDRDETIGPNKPFRDLAEGLAAAGIASLRYDKRTFAYAATMDGSHLTVDDEVTDDAITALRLLAQQPGVDPRRLFVAGHSLGATMAPRIAQRDPTLAGVIMLAAPARRLLDVSAQQVREQGLRHGESPAQIEASEKAIAAEQQLLAKADPGHPPAGSFGGAPQSYWLSLYDYDQVAVAQHLPIPLLIMQGDADFQVSPTADFARWQQALAGQKRASFHLYPDLSHLFMPKGPSGTLQDYQAPGHVDAQVIHDLADWIKAQPARS
jgi:dienelactone hydrolase